MPEETRLDEIQILAHQLWEASHQPRENYNIFLEQAQRQISEEKSRTEKNNHGQNHSLPKPVIKIPL